MRPEPLQFLMYSSHADKLSVGAFVTWRILYAPHACGAPRKGRCIVYRIAADACGLRIGVIAAITRQIGRMRPTVLPTVRPTHCGRL